MKYIISADGWQDSKKCNLDINTIKEYFGQFYKFRINRVYRELGYMVNMRFYRLVDYIRFNKVSMYRIVKIEFFVISRHFEIIYRKRHYGNLGTLYYRY